MTSRFSKLSFALLAAAVFMSAASAADENFGFGAEGSAESSVPLSEPSAASSSLYGVKIGGEVSAGITSFADGMYDFESLNEMKAGNLFSGRLDLTATGTNADAVLRLNIPSISSDTAPVTVDEVYLRAYFGKLDVEGGLRKLTWGRADSQGPLDVLNPRDLTDLTVTDSMKQKIARPMVHLSYSLGSFTKLEGVVIPSFQGHRIATEGRWAPRQIAEMPDAIVASVPAGPMQPGIQDEIRSSLDTLDMTSLYPDTSALEYGQAGARFTTTVGSSDIGIQYFYGNLPRPAISVITVFTQIPPIVDVTVAYNRYHQIGADWAAVLGAFNARAELAANITEDISGDDGEVYNPSVLWSVGFDRNLFAAVNLNAQGTGSIRLMDGKVGSTIADTENGSNLTQTKITVQLSRKFRRDELEVKAAAMYGIEDADFLVLPSLIWTRGDVSLDVTGGIFGGSRDGELGQYYENNYVKASLTYKF